VTELDPRWDWLNVQALGDPGPVWVKGQCRHTELVPVDSTVTGQEVARLCLTCDRQLPPREEPEMWRAVPPAPDYGIWITTEQIRST
jgi:hypothetical protein